MRRVLATIRPSTRPGTTAALRLSGAAPILAGALFAVVAASSASRSAELSATIGMPTPMTGAEATFGDAMVKGAQIAIAEAKGINVKLDVQDDACDPQNGVNAVNKLVTDKVAMVVGFHCSGAALPALPILHRAHIPTIISQALHPAITDQGFPEVFRTISTSAQEAPAAAKILLETYKGKSFALVHDNSAIQKNLADLTVAHLKEAHGNVLSESAITPHTTEFGVAVANIVQLNPDAVFLVLYYPEAALLTKQLLAAGYKGKILEADSGIDPGFIKIAGEDVAEQVSFVTQPVTSQFPEAKAFSAAYKAKFGQEPGVLSAYTYDAMNVAITVLKQTNGTNPDKLIAALKAYKGKGITGDISFDQHGQLVGAIFVRVVVKNGDFVLP